MQWLLHLLVILWKCNLRQILGHWFKCNTQFKKKNLLHDDVSLFFFFFFKQYYHIEILYQKSINKTVYKSKSVQSTGEKYIYRYVKTL